MPRTIRAIDYYYVKVADRPGEACGVLKALASRGVNLLVFHIIPGSASSTQLALFPEDPDNLIEALDGSGLDLNGPHRALLIQGDDELGALVEIHRRLFDAGINVASSSGITDGCKGYGYVVYLRREDIDRALSLLEA
ncbi:hypothetical protein KKG45_05195 [bacterium]|nr:hypothetical protein [bacterium]MBU1072624.1 hypothetical protein [bacterium]MBU1676368.1 hypothetical protein [bacterium]